MSGELYSYIANGPLLRILCGGVILIVFVQAILFVRQAYFHGREMGVSTVDLKKIMANSAVFSIVPSIPILMTYIMLIPTMGKYFPWLRLSVVGSGTYEYLAADTGATALGFQGMTDPALSAGAFVTIMWVATICILGGPTAATFFLKKIDSTMVGMSKKAGFAPKIAGAMFVGMVVTLAAPRVLDYKNPLGIITCLISGAAVLLIQSLARKTNIAVLSDFSFPIAMVLGMAASILLNSLFI